MSLLKPKLKVNGSNMLFNFVKVKLTKSTLLNCFIFGGKLKLVSHHL